MLKGCLIGGGIVVGLFVIAVVFAAVMVTRQPDLSGSMTQVEVSAMSMQDLDFKIDRFKTDLASAPIGTPVTLEVTQDEVTSKIDGMIKASSARIPVRDVSVNFRGGLLHVSGVMSQEGHGPTFTAECLVEGRDTNLCVSIRSFRMGLLPLPPGLVDAMISNYAPGFDLSSIPLPIDTNAIITHIVLADGIATLEATSK